MIDMEIMRLIINPDNFIICDNPGLSFKRKGINSRTSEIPVNRMRK
jgi:hypothetical protein